MELRKLALRKHSKNFNPNTLSWNYQTASEIDGFFTWGQLHFYPGGGYYQDLSDNHPTNLEILKNLRSNNWIDRGTRVVLIEFTIYNANVNKFCNSK